MQAGEFDVARAALDRALALNHHNAEAWLLRGELERRHGNHAEAVDALQSALASDPGSAQAYQLIVDVFLALGDNANALRYLKHGADNARNGDALKQHLEAWN